MPPIAKLSYMLHDDTFPVPLHLSCMHDNSSTVMSIMPAEKPVYDYTGETLFYEGHPHRGDLAVNLALGTTLVRGRLHILRASWMLAVMLSGYLHELSTSFRIGSKLPYKPIPSRCGCH